MLRHLGAKNPQDQLKNYSLFARHPELVVKPMRWTSPACRCYKFLGPEDSAVRHFNILELPSLNAPALRFGESAPTKRPYLLRVASSLRATAVLTAIAVAGVTISRRPTKTRTICSGAGSIVSGKTLSMKLRGTI